MDRAWRKRQLEGGRSLAQSEKAHKRLEGEEERSKHTPEDETDRDMMGGVGEDESSRETRRSVEEATGE
jgi:hypothetical protein